MVSIHKVVTYEISHPGMSSPWLTEASCNTIDDKIFVTLDKSCSGFKRWAKPEDAENIRDHVTLDNIKTLRNDSLFGLQQTTAFEAKLTQTSFEENVEPKKDEASR